MMKFAVIMALCLALVAAAPSENSYKWAADWTSFTTSQEIIAQGASSNTETEVCCDQTSPQCKIEVQDLTGDVYVSVKHQATRQDVEGGRIYQFFAERPQAQYDVVQAKNGSWVCQSTCAGELGPPLTAGFLPYNATYMGKSSPKDIQGCPTGGCDEWQIKETLFGVIVMQTDNYYVYEDAIQGIPVALLSELTPFGEPLGSQTQTWAQYKGFPEGLPLSDFEFLGKKDCPPPQQGCQQQQQDHSSSYYHGLKLAMRLHNRHSYAEYVTDEIRAKYNLDFDRLF
jgi:hypothetical protein